MAPPRKPLLPWASTLHARRCYPLLMAQRGKKRILDALDDLPDDATVEEAEEAEEAIERLYFLSKVEKGLTQLDAGQGIDHDDVKLRFGA